MSTTVYPPQKQLTLRLAITEKYKGIESFFPFPTLSSLPFLLCSLSISLSLTARLPKFIVMLLIKTPEESPSAQHFDWARQKNEGSERGKVLLAEACLQKERLL